MTTLNPALTIRQQMVEAARLHPGDRSRATIEAAAVEVLDEVGIHQPKLRMTSYPHELSGGMRQRVAIAMALINEPKLLIADEPTTALDVTTQAQILDLFGRLRDTRGLSILLVTHDLGVVAEACDSVAVMYAGEVVESGPVSTVLLEPGHPYTRELIAAIPQFVEPGSALRSLPGTVAAPGRWPNGCRFAPRCSAAIEECSNESVNGRQVGAVNVRCIRWPSTSEVDVRVVAR
jgi:peptide/nickel transport system ATP-binding protein/oligopeptide transport system ATP-binding protein